MRSKIWLFSALVAALFLVSSPAVAHHGAAGYDNSKLTVFKATITSFNWTNHCEIELIRPTRKAIQHWTIEAPPPTMLVERGWNRKSLKPGDVVTMSLNAAKNGAHSGIMRKAGLSSLTEKTVGLSAARRARKAYNQAEGGAVKYRAGYCLGGALAGLMMPCSKFFSFAATQTSSPMSHGFSR